MNGSFRKVDTDVANILGKKVIIAVEWDYKEASGRNMTAMLYVTEEIKQTDKFFSLQMKTLNGKTTLGLYNWPQEVIKLLMVEIAKKELQEMIDEGKLLLEDEDDHPLIPPVLPESERWPFPVANEDPVEKKSEQPLLNQRDNMLKTLVFVLMLSFNNNPDPKDYILQYYDKAEDCLKARDIFRSKTNRPEFQKTVYCAVRWDKDQF